MSIASAFRFMTGVFALLRLPRREPHMATRKFYINIVMDTKVRYGRAADMLGAGVLNFCDMVSGRTRILIGDRMNIVASNAFPHGKRLLVILEVTAEAGDGGDELFRAASELADLAATGIMADSRMIVHQVDVQPERDADRDVMWRFMDSCVPPNTA